MGMVEAGSLWVSADRRVVLVQVPPEVDSEAKVQVQVSCFCG